jgi:hypothetical protein
MGPLLAPQLRSVLFDFNRIARVGDRGKRGLAVLFSFISTLKLTVGDVSLELDIEPEASTADSGDLEIDRPLLFVAIGEAADESFYRAAPKGQRSERAARSPRLPRAGIVRGADLEIVEVNDAACLSP